MGKGDIAHYKQFLLFPQCFLPNQIIVSPFVHFFDIISLFVPELEEPKICISGKGLKGEQTHTIEKHGNYSKDNNLLFYRWSKCESLREKLIQTILKDTRSLFFLCAFCLV